jgi:hypothetical protein
MKSGKRAPRSSLGHLLFMTWFVAVGCVITGVALPVATLVASLLTLLFLKAWFDESPQRDRTYSDRSEAGSGP